MVVKAGRTAVSIDDFAIRKGQTLRAGMTDPVTHAVIDLLNSRAAEEVTEWLKTYEDIRTVVRDGSLGYRKAAEDAHPGCVRIGDRFHLVKNVSGALNEYVKSFPKILYVGTDKEESPAKAVTAGAPVQRSMTEREIRRMERAQEVRRLSWEEHLRDTEIARRLGLDRKTVSRYRADDFDPRTRTGPRTRGIMPYEKAVRTMIAGGRNAKEIWIELKGNGYTQEAVPAFRSSSNRAGRRTGSLNRKVCALSAPH